ncbi:MAG: hypothetical protein IT375_13185 [Polyangiaceae bacterium]|nr:hypothetical protein [Polyangiaceae bacterium]MCK6535650.1 hypothetical protein [Polyangiaceae bacterium]
MTARSGLAAFCLTLTGAARAGDAVPPSIDVREVGPDAETFDDRRRPEARAWTERPIAVEAQLGLGAPLGLVGVAVDLSPSAGFSWNLGAGISVPGPTLQLGTAVRLRLIPTTGFAVGAEGGLSFGPYSEQSDCPSNDCPPAYSWERAVWGHVGLMLERRSQSGLTLRWSFGGAGIFNVTQADCERCDATDEPSTWHTTVPYTLVAAGWAFGS